MYAMYFFQLPGSIYNCNLKQSTEYEPTESI